MKTRNITGQNDQGGFRDHISTVDKDGKRVWIYPKKPSGRYYKARTVVSIILMAILFGGPFITINGHPVLLLNILEREFYILGFRFWPQDMFLFGLSFISLIVFIVLFTVAYGRLFCGWICPQTIFMEMLFRKIEYFIEGDARQQKKLDASPWTIDKILKKGTKHVIFYGLSFIIGNTFLAYIIGKDQLFHIMSQPPSEHIVGFTAMVIFSLIFYWVFSWFREQACTLVCPYGRLQGVLLDSDSIVVHYDFVRGEPRGKKRKKGGESFGDCVDCYQCVKVCPTGIDIRNGTQLECINCTACMDACDAIMEKVDKPGGLIRYASYNSIKNGIRKLITPKIVGYSAILTALLFLIAVLVIQRKPVQVIILRTPGVMYQVADDGDIINLYNIKMLNKTYEDMPIRLELTGMEGELKMVSQLHVPAEEMNESAFFIELPPGKLKAQKTRLDIAVYTGDDLIDVINTTFIGPNK